MRQQLSSPAGALARRLIGGIVILAVLMTSFLIISLQLNSGWIHSFDTAVTKFVHGFGNPAADGWARFMDRFGSGYGQSAVFVIAAYFLLFRLKHKRETVLLLISLAGGGLSNSLIKSLVERARPDIAHLVQATGYSFPSGHSMVSAAFFGFLGYLLWLNLRERGKPAWYVPIVAAALILSIGASRIYAGVHYPSDVLAGFIGGGIWMAVCIIVLHAVRRSRRT